MKQATIEAHAKANEAMKKVGDAAASVAEELADVCKQASGTAQVFQVLGGLLPKERSEQEIQDFVSMIHGETSPDKNDGTRIHIQYKAFGQPTAAAIACAQRAEELGLPRDRYTGRVKRIWKNKAGEQCLTVMVELERDHMYRTFNLSRGRVFRMVKLGE